MCDHVRTKFVSNSKKSDNYGESSSFVSHGFVNKIMLMNLLK